MHAVAEQIGVTKPVIYGQFGGRAELLNALLRREQEQALAQLAAIWPNDQSFAHPSEVLPSLLSCFLDAVRDAPDRWTCIVMPMPDMPAEFHAAREQARATVLAAACELARRLGSSGPLDPEIVGHAIVALFEMAARLVLTDPDHFDPARFVAAARAAFAV
jgi:AcrR family transcriptional regulator